MRQNDGKRGPRGFDGNKKVKGRKRSLLVDSLGLLVRVLVHPANWSEHEGLKRLLRRVPLYARWQRIVADAGYNNAALTHYCLSWFAVDLLVPTEAARKSGHKGFVPQPVRWVVERTFAWLGKYRRLSKDYEALPQVSEAFIYLAAIHILVRRLATK